MADDDKKSTLSLVTQVAALVALYLYFGGWSYATALRSKFGLLPTSIETPMYFYIVYAYTVFFTSFVGWFLVIAISAAWCAVARVRFVLAFEILVLTVLATLPFYLISRLAESRAQEEYSFMRSGGLRQVHIVARLGQENRYPEGLIRASSDDHLWLLMEAGSRTYVFDQKPPDKGSSLLPDAQLYSLKSSDVELEIRLEGVRQSR